MDVDSKLPNDGGMRPRILLLVIFLGGCSKEQPSPIVQKVEAAGAGDLSGATQQSIEDWFRKHTELAVDVRNECKPIRESAPANWANTTEGRVCSAASVASVFNFKERKGDGRGFEATK